LRFGLKNGVNAWGQNDGKPTAAVGKRVAAQDEGIVLACAAVVIQSRFLPRKQRFACVPRFQRAARYAILRPRVVSRLWKKGINMGAIDILVFVVFVVSVISIGLWKSKGEQTHSEHGAQDYFLAGRGLTWWLIGFSLIAANISTEQFVGMSGKAADWLGMAIASYEWMAAITLVVVAFLFLPTFLKSGIYTIPEFLEYRYNTFARTVMALCTMVILVGVPTASVIYSGAKVITGNFQGVAPFGFDLGNITVGCWIIGILSAVYVFAGGLKACAWADLIQGTALVLGGVVIAAFALSLLADRDPQELMQTARNQEVTAESLQNAGPIQRFWDLNKGPLPDGKTHMVRDIKDKEIPWTALLIGLWIPNFFYWGLNQYITQRTLGSRSLAEGQRGIVFAAFLKLIIPFIVVVPGILAYNLFQGQLKHDAVNRNALLLSEDAPDLYVSLSDTMKPDRDQVRNKNIVARVDENLSRSRTPAKPFVYKFDATFANLHPQDVAAVVAYNLRQVDGKLAVDGAPDENASPAAWAAFSQQLAATVSERAAETLRTETLVALDYDVDPRTTAQRQRHQRLCAGGHLRRGGQFHRRHVELGFDHLCHGHLPQVAEGSQPIRTGHRRPRLRRGIRVDRHSDRSLAGASPLRRYLHLYPGIPGLYFVRYPGHLLVRGARASSAALRRHGGLAAEPGVIWDLQVQPADSRPEEHRRAADDRHLVVPGPHGPVFRTDHRRAEHHDAGPPAGQTGGSTGEPQDGHDDIPGSQSGRRGGDPADARPVRDLLVTPSPCAGSSLFRVHPAEARDRILRGALRLT
jgi:SSS family solute:Na+ symporter